MFTAPIKHVRINSLEELVKFSHRTGLRPDQKNTWWQNNGQIAFLTHDGVAYVTPYRPELSNLLTKEGFTEDCIYVPFSNGGDIPTDYVYLQKIADEECWSYTYEQAYQLSQSNGILPVDPGRFSLHIKEVGPHHNLVDKNLNKVFSSMVSLYLMNESEENVATYIYIDNKTALVCDEYGRTFLVKSNPVINNFINELIDAGYTRTPHPERYVQPYSNCND